MFGVNEYYDDLLLEATSPEEIKKILEYQFVEGKGVPQEALNIIFDMDPTKKKSYTRWALSLWDKDHEVIEDAIEDGTLKKMFEYFQSRANTGLNLAMFDSFDKAKEMLPYEDPILAKEGDGGPEDDYDIVFQSDDWVIAVPHTYEADRKLGRGMRWCTAGAFGDGEDWWEKYSPYGPLWVNFDKRGKEIGPKDNKEYPYIRYQLLFEFNNWVGEFKDRYDDTIKLDEIDMPEDVIEFYGEQNPKYKEIIENGSVDIEALWEECYEARMNHSHLALYYEDEYLSLMPEVSQEPNMDFDDCYYYLYDENEEYDPISYTSFDPDNFIVKHYENYPIVVLRDNRGNTCIATADATVRSWRTCEFNLHEDIKFYGEAGDFVYFTDSDDLFLYDRNGQCIHESLKYEPYDIFDPDINSLDIEGYESCLWFETVDRSGFHSLYYADVDNNDLILIIKRDIPVNGERYVLKFDERGNGYFVGKYSKHWLSDEEEGEEREQSFNIKEEIYSNIYIVDLGNNSLGKPRYNIFDNELYMMELDKPFNDYCLFNNNDDTLKLIFSEEEPSKVVAFDIELRSVITPVCNNIQKIKSFYIYTNPEGEEPGMYFFKETENVPKYTGIKCMNVRKCLCESYFLVDIEGNGNLNVINLETGEITLPSNVDNFGELGYYGTDPGLPYLLIRKQDDQTNIMLINFKTNKIITNNVATMPSIIKDKFIYVKFKDGKYNMFYNDKQLIPQNVDCFRHINTEKYRNTNIYSFELNGRLFFLNADNGNITPKRGIDMAEAMISNVSNGGIYVMQTHGNNWFNFRYNAIENSVVDEGDGYFTPEQLQQANAIINSQAVQIAENFRKMYKKIIDVDKNR